MLNAPEPPEGGVCELCGSHHQGLRLLIVGEFVGWACRECVQELQDSVLRKYCGTVEHTEPSE